MGGPSAPDDLAQAVETQVWLAVSDDPQARSSGGYYYHRGPWETHPAASDPGVQQGLLDACRDLTGVEPSRN
jgi:hypothetical protein